MSIKIIIMAYRNSVAIGRSDKKLDTILAKPEKRGKTTEESQDRSGPEE